MDEFIKTMIERMRSERCPDRVLEKVRKSIAAEHRPPALGNRVRIGLSLATAVLIVGTALFLFMPVPSSDRASINLAPEPQPQAVDKQELYASLASLGLVLREAGNRSGTIILQETLPLLRQGLETTKNAITFEIKP
jgi:hypothetical protein